jgi:hypothetical protein
MQPLTRALLGHAPQHPTGLCAGIDIHLSQYAWVSGLGRRPLAVTEPTGNGSGIHDGEIAVGSRWTQQLDGGHLAGEAQNKIALGICLVGNFDERRPTTREMDSLRALVEALMARCKLTPRAVKTRQQINIVHARCPGMKFPASSFLESPKSPGH